MRAHVNVNARIVRVGQPILNYTRTYPWNIQRGAKAHPTRSGSRYAGSWPGPASRRAATVIVAAPLAGAISRNRKDLGACLGADRKDEEHQDLHSTIRWGAEKADQVSECSFERGLVLATLEIYYDDAAGLSGYGVQLYKDTAVSSPAFPVAFNGFCQPPKITV